MYCHNKICYLSHKHNDYITTDALGHSYAEVHVTTFQKTTYQVKLPLNQ